MGSKTVRVHAALITVSSIYGYFYVAMKLLYKTLTPSELILLRFVLTAVVVLLIDRFILKHPIPDKSDWPRIAGLGLVGVFLVQILIAWGVHHTTAFHTSLIMATIPMFTLIFSIVGGRETFHFYKLIGILIAFIGVSILLFFSGSPDTPLPDGYLWGDLIILLNALAFSWYLLGSQKILQKYEPFQFMAYCYISSAVLFSALFVGQSLVSRQFEELLFFTRMGWNDWLLMGYVVVFASIVSYTLNNYALKRVNPSIVAIYMFIQPIISAVAGFYLLAETFNWHMALATIITFAGVVIATITSQKGTYLRKTAPEAEAVLETSPEKAE
jgi:drug/metabolite transporter (DMT)-like permease